ncbi:Lrp/AsnC family transcriptional regulator [Thermoproteota archaeon]
MSKKNKLITELRKNSRKKVTEIAAKHCMPASTLFDMLHRMEKQELIKHKAIVDFQSLGFTAHIIMLIKTSKEKRLRLKDYLNSSKNINTLLQINEGFDYFIEALFRNQKEAFDFIGDLSSSTLVEEQKVHFVIDVLEKEKFLTQEDHFE